MSVVETASHRHHAYFDPALMLIFPAAAISNRRCGNVHAGCGQYHGASLAAGVPHRPTALSSRCRFSIARRGDVVLVRPGERVPIDGSILSGERRMDSIVTGETPPARRGRARPMPAQ